MKYHNRTWLSEINMQSPQICLFYTSVAVCCLPNGGRHYNESEIRHCCVVLQFPMLFSVPFENTTAIGWDASLNDKIRLKMFWWTYDFEYSQQYIAQIMFCCVLYRFCIYYSWQWIHVIHSYCMMTSSNGNIVCVTVPLCGDFTGPGEFPAQRPVTRSFDVFFDLCLNKRLSKQSWGWWFETPSWSLWRQCNGVWPHWQWSNSTTYPLKPHSS